MAGYKRGAEEGNATCQSMLGLAFQQGRGVDQDYQLALEWYLKAAAQDSPVGVGQLGVMYAKGEGVEPSWRRAREYYQRSIDLGSSHAMMRLPALTRNIQKVGRLGHRRVASQCDLTSRPRDHVSPPARPRRPSWTSGWRCMEFAQAD